MSAVNQNSLTPDMCGFDLTWGWYCSEPKVDGQNLCEKHLELKCKVDGCNGKITGLCSNTFSFVCGGNVCEIHGCNSCGRK